MKQCSRCEVEKTEADFQELSGQKDGLHPWCRPCVAREHRSRRAKRQWKEMNQGKQIQATMEIKAFENQPESVRKIVECLMAYPSMSKKEIAAETGLSSGTVSSCMTHNSYIRALRELASKTVSGMIPLAVQGYQDSLKSPNADVKLKASVKLLENENIMGAQKVDVTINDLRSRPITELQRVIEEAKSIPPPIIEAELVS